MTIKKAYAQIAELLEANQNRKVSSIMPELIELMSAKVNQCNYRKDADGNVTHVFCYYHKKWEDVTEVEYGKKASNKTTGLNTMCKEGVSKWTKQQRDAKKAKDTLLEGVANGEVDPYDLQGALEEIELQRQVVVALVGNIE